MGTLTEFERFVDTTIRSLFKRLDEFVDDGKDVICYLAAVL